MVLGAFFIVAGILVMRAVRSCLGYACGFCLKGGDGDGVRFKSEDSEEGR